MIDPEHVRAGITDRCAMVDHVCSGLMCRCYCHDQDHARLRDQLPADAAAWAAPSDPPPLTGAEVLRRLFTPAVLAGDLEAAAAEADRLLGEHERQVREKVAKDILSASFGVAADTDYRLVLAQSRAVNSALKQCALIARGGPAATAHLPYISLGLEPTPEHLHALGCYRASRGLPPLSATTRLASIDEINQAVTWWNDGGHRGR